MEVIAEAIHGKVHYPITPGVAAEIKQKVKKYIRDSIAETKRADTRIHKWSISGKTGEKQARPSDAETNKKRATKRMPDIPVGRVKKLIGRRRHYAIRRVLI